MLVAYVYERSGFGALSLLVVVLVVFQYLLRELLLSHERAERLAVAAARRADLDDRDARAARPHDRPPLRRGRPLRPRDGGALRLPAAEQELVHTAGLLHDIGKFAFPDSILLADSRLTDEQWEAVSRHPEDGARIVRRVEGYGPVADIVLSHHERWDGRGYPRGLAGEAIPLAARLIAVADTYDVITARDSYRKPVSAEEAVAELRRVAGSQLDPRVVEALAAVLGRASCPSATATTPTSRPSSRSSSGCATTRTAHRPDRFPAHVRAAAADNGWQLPRPTREDRPMGFKY